MNGFERRRNAKKNDILQAAQNLFIAYGVQKVSIAEIAEKASVSQVTIYNYFGSKQDLIHHVIVYYVESSWAETEKLFASDIPFPEKIKQVIFNNKEIASQINPEFYNYVMKEYTSGLSYIEEFYTEKALPKFIKLFDEGKEQGYVDPELSNEAILFYIQIFREAMLREDIYQKILPMTEDITKLLFYGIVGKKDD